MKKDDKADVRCNHDSIIKKKKIYEIMQIIKIMKLLSHEWNLIACDLALYKKHFIR